MKQIVIEIDENVYDLVKRFEETIRLIEKEDDTVETAIMRAIVNGTLLPNGHGRLIDADELLDANIDTFSQQTELKIKFAPTIIEADKEVNADVI